MKLGWVHMRQKHFKIYIHIHVQWPIHHLCIYFYCKKNWLDIIPKISFCVSQRKKITLRWNNMGLMMTNDVESNDDGLFNLGWTIFKNKKAQRKEGEPQRNQRKPLSSKSGLFIMQPSEKENKHSLGQEIELEAREEGIEISQCSLTKLLYPQKKRLSTGTSVWDGQAYPRLVRESCWANNGRLVPNPDLQSQALLCLPTMPCSPNDIYTQHTRTRKYNRITSADKSVF